MRSKVYFTNMRATPELNLLQKLAKLIKSAGIEEIDFKKQFAAIKIHLGEPGNIAYLRPNFSKVVADLVKELGGKPFLTDSNTLYVGRRKDALEHLDAAYENGYNPFVTSAMKGLKEATVSALGKFFDGTWADIGGKVETLNLQAGDYVGLPTTEASWGFKTFTMDEYNKLIEDIRSGALTVSAEIADHPAVDASVTVNYID